MEPSCRYHCQILETTNTSETQVPWYNPFSWSSSEEEHQPNKELTPEETRSQGFSALMLSISSGNVDEVQTNLDQAIALGLDKNTLTSILKHALHSSDEVINTLLSRDVFTDDVIVQCITMHNRTIGSTEPHIRALEKILRAPRTQNAIRNNIDVVLSSALSISSYEVKSATASRIYNAINDNERIINDFFSHNINIGNFDKLRECIGIEPLQNHLCANNNQLLRLMIVDGNEEYIRDLLRVDSIHSTIDESILISSMRQGLIDTIDRLLRMETINGQITTASMSAALVSDARGVQAISFTSPTIRRLAECELNRMMAEEDILGTKNFLSVPALQEFLAQRKSELLLLACESQENDLIPIILSIDGEISATVAYNIFEKAIDLNDFTIINSLISHGDKSFQDMFYKNREQILNKAIASKSIELIDSILNIYSVSSHFHLLAKEHEDKLSNSIIKAKNQYLFIKMLEMKGNLSSSIRLIPTLEKAGFIIAIEEIIKSRLDVRDIEALNEYVIEAIVKRNNSLFTKRILKALSDANVDFDKTELFDSAVEVNSSRVIKYTFNRFPEVRAHVEENLYAFLRDAAYEGNYQLVNFLVKKCNLNNLSGEDATKIIQFASVGGEDLDTKVLSILLREDVFKNKYVEILSKDISDFFEACEIIDNNITIKPEHNDFDVKSTMDRIHTMLISGSEAPLYLASALNDIDIKALDYIFKNYTDKISDKTIVGLLRTAIYYNNAERLSKYLAVPKVRDIFESNPMKYATMAAKRNLGDIFKVILTEASVPDDKIPSTPTQITSMMTSLCSDEMRSKRERLSASAHRLGAKGKSDDYDHPRKYMYSDEITGLSSSLKEEGSLDDLASQWFREDLKDLPDSLKRQYGSELMFAAISDAFNIDDAINLKWASRINGFCESIFDKYLSGMPVVIPSGCDGHSTTLIAIGNFIVFTNRGYGSDGSGEGTKIYKLREPLSLDDINGFLEDSLLDDEMFATNHRLKELGGIKVAGFQQKDQRWGTCGYVNKKSSLEGLVALLKALSSDNELKLDESIFDINTDNIGARIEEHKPFSRDLYKKTTAEIRDIEVGRMLEEIGDIKKSRPSEAQRKNMEAMMHKIVDFIKNHHHEKSHESIRTREVDRAKIAYEALTELGFNIDSAIGPDALAIVKKERPQLVFSGTEQQKIEIESKIVKRIPQTERAAPAKNKDLK